MRWRSAAALVGLLLLGGTAAAQPAQLPPTNGRPELLSDPTRPMPPTNVGGRPTMLPDYSPPQAPESPALIVLDAEYILMRPRWQGADFGIADPNTDANPQGPVQSLGAGLSSGFRAGIGYHPGASPWELSLGYTFFRATDTQNFHRPGRRPALAHTDRAGNHPDRRQRHRRLAMDLQPLRL